MHCNCTAARLAAGNHFPHSLLHTMPLSRLLVCKANACKPIQHKPTTEDAVLGQHPRSLLACSKQPSAHGKAALQPMGITDEHNAHRKMQSLGGNTLCEPPHSERTNASCTRGKLGQHAGQGTVDT